MSSPRGTEGSRRAARTPPCDAGVGVPGKDPSCKPPSSALGPAPQRGWGGGALVPAVASALSTSCSPRSCRLRARLRSRLPGDGPRLHHTGAPGERERGPRLVAGSRPHRAPRLQENVSEAVPPTRGPGDVTGAEVTASHLPGSVGQVLYQAWAGRGRLTAEARGPVGAQSG